MSLDRTKYLSQAEVQKLITSAKSLNGRRGRLVWMVVDLALNTGLRVSELAMLKIEDIDFNRGMIHVTRLKRRKTKKCKETIPITDFKNPENAKVKVEDIDFDRGLIHVTHLKHQKDKKREEIPLGDLRGHLKEYIGDRTQGALFIGERGQLTAQGLQRIWYKAIERAGLPKLSIHGARHTCGTLLYKKTKNLRLVQKQLGHVKPSTTAIYADVSFEDMQDGLNGLYD